ncbi:MAG: hypothetical protein MUC96_35335 [Myxococcaceae bacterium]|nr:hypothetical protein [Myxococcaceae bacterium]
MSAFSGLARHERLADGAFASRRCQASRDTTSTRPCRTAPGFVTTNSVCAGSTQEGFADGSSGSTSTRGATATDAPSTPASSVTV